MPAQGLRPMGTLALPLEGSESGLTFVQKDLPCAAGWGRDWEDAEVVERPRARAPGPGGGRFPGLTGACALEFLPWSRKAGRLDPLRPASGG